MKQTQEEVTFDSFGFKESILKAVKEAGFTVPSPVQEKVIPQILLGRDVVAQAQTGTGKTAAFGLPALNLIENTPGVGMLVITPTRELAQQVSDELFRFGKQSNLRTVTVYGGQSVMRQIDMIRRGAQIVVATPGRLLDLLQSNRLPNFNPSIVVLDEADEMLNMGFLDDIKMIFTFLPKERQTLLFSATMPEPIQQLAKKFLQDPVTIKITTNESVNQDIEQLYYVIRREQERDDALIRLIDSHNPQKSIVFCKTKKEVDRLSSVLMKLGFSARGLHGDMEQNQRQQVVNSFKDGDTSFLIATDVAARGLNVIDVTHVFNYHIPFDGESYVHRIGRTGRAGRKGVAITLLLTQEFRILQQQLKIHGSKVQLCAIPGLKEVEKLQTSKFLDRIRSQPCNTEASEILKQLQEEMDLTQISMQLISMFLTREQVNGPDQIGVPVHELDKVATQMRSEGPRRRGSDRKFGHRRPEARKKQWRHGS